MKSTFSFIIIFFLLCLQSCLNIKSNVTKSTTPTINSIALQNSQVSVSFTPLTGVNVSSYIVTSHPGSITATGNTSPIVVHNLSYGTEYTFTVEAMTSAGKILVSNSSTPITPYTIPGKPSITTMVGGNSQATIFFSAPAFNGGAAITSYKVIASPDGTTVSSASSPVTITGLTNGTPYTFTVKATNLAGDSLASNSSSTLYPALLPGAPIMGLATVGNSQASVSFSPPLSNGGAAISSYIVTSNPDGITATGTFSPITISGLTNGTTYTFSVVAINSTGAGAASSASNSVTPLTVPGAPVIGTAVAGDGLATISFSPPSVAGGSPITSYTVTSSPDGLTTSGASSPIVVSGLTNGTHYTFTVIATNAAGNSLTSAVTNSVMPVGVPGAPTINSVASGDTSVSIAFSAPATDGGGTITSYTATSSPDGITATGTTSPLKVTGLTNGTTYTFTLVATNSSGSGNASSVSVPVIPVQINVAKIISSSNSEHTCGIDEFGHLKCWGLNSYYRLGDGTLINKTYPTSINLGTSYDKGAIGAYHSCAITSAGVLKCWGYNATGAIGDNTVNTRPLPTVINSGVSYSSVSLGEFHTCGITTAGVLKCWGSNSFGQLGDGTTTDQLAPEVIDSGEIYSSVAVGKYHSCGLTNAGVLKCWGSNGTGQLGNGTLTNSYGPEVIDSGTTFFSVAIGEDHTCAITNAGVLKCWGDNSYSQLGDNTIDSNLLPEVIDAGVSYKDISAGRFHTCGLTLAGALKCWGLNSSGQVGDNTQIIKTIPTAIDFGTSYDSLSLGSYHSCAITSSQQLKCWGNNSYGELGDGSTTDRLSPVTIPF